MGRRAKAKARVNTWSHFIPMLERDVHGGYCPGYCPICGSEDIVGVVAKIPTDHSSVRERVYPICPDCHWNSLGVSIAALDAGSADLLSNAIAEDMLSVLSGVRPPVPKPLI